MRQPVQYFSRPIVPPRVKSGHISEIRLVELEEDPWSRGKVESLAEAIHQVVEENQDRSDCFVEIERLGCTILQVGDLRVTCASPPFSDAWEITVVRPVARLSIADYDLQQDLIDRLSDHHRGIFVVGKPGSGKSILCDSNCRSSRPRDWCNGKDDGGST